MPSEYLSIPVFVPSTLAELNANGVYAGYNSQHSFPVYVSGNYESYLICYQDNVPRGIAFSPVQNTRIYVNNLNNMGNVTYYTTSVLRGQMYYAATTGIPVFAQDNQLTVFANFQAALNYIGNFNPVTYHPIHYSYIGDCTITGPLDAPSGQDCVVTVNPAQGWTFRGASGVKIVDALGESVPFIVNGNSFSFTMPQF